jgi:alpha-galactosidase
MRNQHILNLGRFVKWDMNRNVSEPGWPDAASGRGDARELWVRYVYGVYRVWKTLAERHPQVLWQSCSGGGGRTDLGMLQMVDQYWVSDNTEATARPGIQEGFAQAYPAITMESQVTHMGKPLTPLPFRFHVSMLGVLGMSVDLLTWSEEEIAEGAAQIALYKEIRPLVQRGDQYRLLPAQGKAYTAWQYVSKDQAEAVLFAFRTHLPEPARVPPIYLQGLDLDAQYTVEGLGGVHTGKAWMNQGILLPLGNYESTVRKIKRV